MRFCSSALPAQLDPSILSYVTCIARCVVAYMQAQLQSKEGHLRVAADKACWVCSSAQQARRRALQA